MFVLAGLVALIPGAGAVWGVAASAFGFIVRCKPCMYALGVAALCGWTAIHVHRADVAHCEQRISDDHARAEIARQQRDSGISDELEKAYRPKISALEQRAGALQQEVTKYANSKPVAPSGNCKLGTGPLRLRQLPR